MSKELFMDAWQVLYERKIAEGWSQTNAERYADDNAYETMADMLADIGDAERLRRKER